MTRSEAGRLGALKTNKLEQEQKAQRIIEYNKKPNLCKSCGKPIPYEKRNQKFCSHSCSAKMSNHLRNKNKLIVFGQCLNCKKDLYRKNKKYCSNLCQKQFNQQQIFKEVEEKGYFPFNEKTNETNRVFVRKYLISKFGYKCSVCGLSEWMGQPIPLVADHIDGDTSNHKIENFRMVCENCNALLPTYKSKNRKSKRSWRKKYY